MKAKSLQIGFIGIVLSVATALAAPSSAIQGIVNDAKGHAIKGAEVRIESRDGSKLFKTVKTDGHGHYVSDGLAGGVYRVTLVVNGAVKASIMNTKTTADRPDATEFRPETNSASQASALRRMESTWSGYRRTPGAISAAGWVEVDENDSADTGALNVKRSSAEALHREQMQNAGAPQSVPGGNTSVGP